MGSEYADDAMNAAVFALVAELPICGEWRWCEWWRWCQWGQWLQTVSGTHKHPKHERA